MADMYQKVRKNPGVQKDRSLRNMILICVLFAAAAAGTIFWFLGYFSRYQTFVGKLSESTVYAYDNRCLRAETDGEDLWVNLKNNYGIYTHITVYGAGSEKRSLPEENADVVLDYGNGAVLMLWDVEGSSRAHSLFLHYEDDTGYSYSYVSDDMDLETIRTKYLEVKTNRPWE